MGGAGERWTPAWIVQVDHIRTPARETDHPREHVDRVERETAPGEWTTLRLYRFDTPTGRFIAELTRERTAQDEVYPFRGGELREIERVVDSADAQIGTVQLNQNPQVFHGRLHRSSRSLAPGSGSVGAPC